MMPPRAIGSAIPHPPRSPPRRKEKEGERERERERIEEEGTYIPGVGYRGGGGMKDEDTAER
jgi:hypothetical protein